MAEWRDRLTASSALPWGRPRFELLLLALVALAALLPVYPVTPQDQSRLCLTHALEHGRISDDRCLVDSVDRSSYGGHLYSDKPPGMSLLELPAAELVGLGPAQEWPLYSLRLWLVRILASGLAFLACAFLVGRVSEGLAPGFGAPSLVAFALGTLMAPLAAANFGHVVAATLGFGAFLFAWRRRPLPAGLLAGAAVLVEYQVALIAAIVAAYVAIRGVRSLAVYVAGLLPGIGLLAAYNAAAFGAPWHLSYKYLANTFASEQAQGFFGIGAPHQFSVYVIFAGGGGLLVVSPVLIAAAAGLVLLARTHPVEAALCGLVTVVFLAVNCGYFLPYGGLSPGPRFLVPALPFLALGLGPAFARYRRLTVALTVLSVLAMTVRLLAWSSARADQQTLWGDLARAPYGVASSSLVDGVRTPLDWLGAGHTAGAALIVLSAAAALAVALRSLPKPQRVRARSGRVLALVAAALVVTADACGVVGWPYTYRQPAQTPGLESQATHAAGVVPRKR